MKTNRYTNSQWLLVNIYQWGFYSKFLLAIHDYSKHETAKLLLYLTLPLAFFLGSLKFFDCRSHYCLYFRRATSQETCMGTNPGALS